MTNHCKFVFRTIATLSLLTILLAIPAVLLADDESIIYPPDSTPFGMTYGDWQAAYWQYFFAIPASTHPVLDTTGADCTVAQSAGPVFYLNSAFPGSIVTRICTVSASKALLVPVASWECSNLEPPPSYGANPQDMRTCAASAMDGLGVTTLKLTVDGKNISQELRQNHVQTPYYDFTMPALPDNILYILEGVTATSGSSVADGYLVMLKPLSPGKHMIHFEGSFLSGPGAPGSFGVTYYLTVQ